MQMRLLTYGDAGEERIALYLDGRALDLHIASRGVIPWNALDFLRGDYWDDIRRFTAHPTDVKSIAIIELNGVRIGAPVPTPGKIIALGLNYRDHAEELKMGIPEEPLLFSKASTAVCGPYDAIIYPRVTTQLDYEVELAIVIGKRCKNVSVEQAENYIAGYTVFNDVTARDLQFKDQQWFRGKSCDTFAPMGPHLVTPDEVGDVHQLTIQSWVNGELRQKSTTANLIFSVPEIVSFVSHHMTLLPGDVIATGTPSGVGMSYDPPRFLNVGDVVEMEVEKIGRMRNTVIAEEQ
ncbi:MAG TPA: FAA hydrolase family protein [Armatimonadetes bacterium]|nr:FAA hydrolase family protein [Armatimonadota bacterium]